MRYNVAQLLKEPVGSTRSYQLDESFTGPQRFAEWACGPVHMLRTHQSILVNATLQIQSTLACARCLGDFVRSSELCIEEEFFPTVDLQTGRDLSVSNEAEEGSLLDSSHMLDLSDTIREYVVTDAPMKPLCQEECSGLCPGCGTNLNLGLCDCDVSAKDPRWHSLANLMEQQKG
jgi:uncharacterized protein